MAVTREFISLNYLKGICAILVVLIHTHLIGKEALIPFYRCAVPLFYMISGFFLMGSDEEWHREKIGRYIKKMLIIWGVTDLVYLLFSCFVFTQYNPFTDASFSSILRTLFLEAVFGGQFCGPLWYITSYVWVLVILRFWKCRPGKFNFMIVGACLLANVLLGSYDFVLPIENIPSYANRNVLTTALPFVMLGGFLKPFVGSYGKRLSAKLFFGLLVLCYLELGFLYFIGSRDGDVFLITPVLSIFAFAWFVNHPDFGKGSWIYKVGKDYSLNIYLFHTLAIWIVGSCAGRLGIKIWDFEFFIVLALAIIVCSIIHYTGKMLKRLAARKFAQKGT